MKNKFLRASEFLFCQGSRLIGVQIRQMSIVQERDNRRRSVDYSPWPILTKNIDCDETFLVCCLLTKHGRLGFSCLSKIAQVLDGGFGPDRRRETHPIPVVSRESES